MKSDLTARCKRTHSIVREHILVNDMKSDLIARRSEARAWGIPGLFRHVRER
jgi:hypothetical protein